MGAWKLLSEILGEADYKPGWRTNSVWDRAADMDRVPAAKQPQTQASKGPPPAATGQVVWHGRQMKDTDLFQAKKDNKTGKPTEGGLIPAITQAKGTVSRAPDGSGIALVPHGYQIDPSVWKDWSPTRSRAEINATTDSAKGVKPTNPTATKTLDVLVQGRLGDDGRVLVTKVVWSPLDRSSYESQTPEARQAKLEILMDTDDAAELSQMFPAKQQSGGLERPQPPGEMAPNPLASPSKVTWSKDSTPQGAARPSAWQDIDLNKVPKGRR